MDSTRWARIEEVFQGALALAGEQRSEFLAQACGDDVGLREEVESLLRSHAAAGPLIDPTVVVQGVELLDEARQGAVAGRAIGPYRLVRELGRGGMGAVYLAERADDQYRKRVAIKLIKGTVADQVLLARFHMERQILANLDHPNVARLLDGGATPDGNPFIVMEYVEGLPIDAYCEQRQLSLTDRLKLFLDVCSAVQYAHQNLVVHRDIKHGNILVTAAGVPKLLDFGIAKLLTGEAGGPVQTHVTSTGMLLMTPDYASPEQARGEPVSTATDVYSLGVLLYRLLTGRPPYRLSGRPPGEMMQIICEATPEKPSLAVGRSTVHGPDVREGMKTPAEAAKPSVQVSTERLKRRLSGDLDNIVLTALRKEPSRRYPSVEQFAADIRRHLDGLPVSARPSTIRYRTSKFLRRHRFGAAAAALILIALLAGVAATVYQARIAAQERDRARIEARKSQQVVAFLQTMLSSADPRWGGRTTTVAEVLDAAAKRVETELVGQPEIEAAVRTTIGMTYLSLGLYDPAEVQLRKALDLRKAVLGLNHIDVASSLRTLAILLAGKGDAAAAEPVCRQALAIARQTAGDSVETASILNVLAELRLRLGDLKDAEKLHREALAMRRALLGNSDPEVAESLNDLAVVVGTKGNYREAASLLEEALAVIRSVYGSEHPDFAANLSNLASMKEALKEYDAAEKLFQEALSLRRKLLGPEHPDVAWTLYNYAFMMFAKGDFRKAARLSQEALSFRGRSLPDANPVVAGALQVLGRSLLELGERDAALSRLRDSLALRRESLPEGHWLIAASESVLGDCLGRMGRYAEAEVLLLRSERALEAALGLSHERTQETVQRIVRLYGVMDKPQKAAEHGKKIAGPLR
jgi:serine/threonine-protein kinase